MQRSPNQALDVWTRYWIKQSLQERWGQLAFESEVSTQIVQFTWDNSDSHQLPQQLVTACPLAQKCPGLDNKGHSEKHPSELLLRSILIFVDKFNSFSFAFLQPETLSATF